VFSSAQTLRDILCNTFSLTNYYAEFTALTPARLNRLREAFRDVIDDLDQLETQEAAGCESAHFLRKLSSSSTPSRRRGRAL
jgi:hypothetical protein